MFVPLQAKYAQLLNLNLKLASIQKYQCDIKHISNRTGGHSKFLT